jgi:hypothetical protein
MRVRTILHSPWSAIATRIAMVFALLVAVAGCKSASYGYGDVTAAQAPMKDDYGGGDYYGEQSWKSAANYEEAPAPPPDASETSTGYDGQYDAETLPQGKAEPDPQQPAPESAERKVVYTATMQLSVFEIDEAMAFTEALPERYGGWVQSRFDNQITIRVPAERLHEAMTELADLGVLLGKTLQASDVTAEYTDLESRLTVLTQMEEQLLALLAKAKTVEESLKIRQELERVRIELEAARARMRTLSELISFSTLTVVLSQRGPISPEVGSNDPFPWVDDLGVEATEYR